MDTNNVNTNDTNNNINNIINKIIIEEAKIKKILSRYSNQESHKKYVDEYNNLINEQDNSS
jgi:predicted RNA-binding protein YlxR (DUF448 family)